MNTGNEAQWLTAHGFLPTNVPVPGAFNIGFNSHHTEGTLPGGTKVNFGSDAAVASGGTAGAVGAWDPSFTQHYYRPLSTTGASAAAVQAASPATQAAAQTTPVTTTVSNTTTTTSTAATAASPAYTPATSPAVDMSGPPPASFDVPAWNGPGATSYSDLKSVRDAQQRVEDTQFAADQAGQRLTEMQYQDQSTIKPSERAAAERELAKAQREHQDALNDLTAAEQKYNEQAKQSPKKSGKGMGENFGQDFVSGIAEAFGFDGSIFGNPADLGIFKLLGGLSKVKAGGAAAGSGGGGDGGGLLGSLLSNIPQAFGAINVGSPQDAAVPFVPAGADAGGAALIPGSQFTGSQPQPAQTTNNYTVDNSMNLEGAQFGTSDLSSSVAPQQAAQGRTRVALRSVP